MNKVKHLHFWVGALGVIAFLLTGQYMYHIQGQLSDVADGPRMIYRSGHIYLLMASIINLVAGTYWVEFQARLKRILQLISSIFLLLSPCLLLAGFFLEAEMLKLLRPYSGAALYALFASALVFLYLGFSSRKAQVL